MSDWQNRVLDFVVDKWIEPLTPLAVAGVATAAILYTVAGREIEKVSVIGWGIVLATPLFVAALWLATTRVPRSPKGSIGFVIAIASDSDEHHRRIREDFVANLRSLINSHKKASQFHLIEYGRRMSARIVDQESARRFREKSQARFMIYGRARSRVMQGKEYSFLNLEGSVAHAPIRHEESKKLAREFGELVPRKLQISRETDVYEFEITSEWLDLGALYIVAIAAMISSEFEYSERMFEQIERRLGPENRRVPAVKQIAQRLPERLTNLYRIWLSTIGSEYVRTRNRDLLLEGEEIADRLLRRCPGSYQAYLFLALAQFTLHRDIAGARRLLSQCKKHPDGTWRFSEAFLYGYEGRLAKARESYSRAFKKVADPRTLVEIEEYIQILLEEEPERFGLHYCAGLVNFFAKKDMAAAKSDLVAFLAKVDSRIYPTETEEAKTLVELADRHLASPSPDAIGSGIEPRLLRFGPLFATSDHE